jgi:CXXC-20-CXXC protein
MEPKAKCPQCAYRFSRFWFFRIIPEYSHQCPGCGAQVKSNTRWEWGFSTLLVLPIILVFLGWLLKHWPAWTVFATTGLMLVTGFVLFPYVTKFDLKKSAKVTGDKV